MSSATVGRRLILCPLRLPFLSPYCCLHFRWNKDRLFEAYLADPAGVQQKCGLSRMHRGITAAGKSSSTAASSAGAPAVAATAVLGECALCGDEMTARSSLDLGCAPNGEHRFCLSCWRSWATAEMDKGPQAIFTRCCGYKCNEILPDDLFLSLLDTKKQRLLSRWFIRSAALGGATLSAHVLLLPSAHASA